MGVPRLRLLSISRQQQLIVHSGRPKVIDPKFSRNIWNILPNNTVTKPHLHIILRPQRSAVLCEVTWLKARVKAECRAFRDPPSPPPSWWERRSWYGGSSLLSVMIVRTSGYYLGGFHRYGAPPLPTPTPSSLRYHHPLCAPLLSMHPPYGTSSPL